MNRLSGSSARAVRGEMPAPSAKPAPRTGDARFGMALACSLLCVTAAARASSAQVFGDPAVSHLAPQRTYHVLDYKLSLHFDQEIGIAHV